MAKEPYQCRKCGSTHISSNGVQYDSFHKAIGQRKKCMNCGREFRIQSQETENNKPLTLDQEALKKAIKDNIQSVEVLSNKFNVPPKIIREALNKLKAEKYNVKFEENEKKVQISTALTEGGKGVLDSKHWQGDKFKIAFASDNHLCSKYAREDVLHSLYDLFESEGIDTVYNCGNWIDGEARFNKNDIHTKGMSAQIEYAVANYPFRKGITTHFITGDDHEGWYAQREGINIGEYFQLKREQAGFNDLKYEGYVEADIELHPGEFKDRQFLRLIHPGGGSSYAVSYKSQKMVEATQPGEKPTVLAIGHYHKMLYHPIRNVHTLQVGCTQDQTPFLRKQGIEANVGGVIVTFYRDKTGLINRVVPDFITFFDRKFYIGKDKYWK